MSESKVQADDLSKMPWISVKIQKTRTDNSGFSIVGHLEEHFTYGMAAEYQAPYAATLQSLVNAIPLLSFVTKTTPIVSPWLTTQYWQGTEVQDMQLTFILEAKSDPLTEIRQPILDLLSLVAPSYDANTTLLRSPIENSFLDQALVKEYSQKLGKTISEVASSSGAAELAGAIADAAKGNVSELQTAFDNALSSATNAMSGLINGVSSIGKQVMGQISQANGTINSAAGSVKQKAEQLVDSATQFINGSSNTGTGGAVSGAAASVGTAATGGANVASAGGSGSGSPNAASTTSTESKPISPTAILMQKMKTPTVSIQIGNYMLFPCVVVTNVTTNILNQIDAYTGWPLSAEVQISFRPMFTQAYGDVVALFLDQPNAATESSSIANSLTPENTVVSSLTSAITSPIKDLGKTITNSATSIANSATNKLSSMSSNVTKSISNKLDNILPW